MVVTATITMLALLATQVSAYPPTLTVDDAIARWAEGRFAVLVDVRTQREWDTGHLPNATFIESLSTNGDTSRLDGCQGCPVAVYCRSGVRAAAAASVLEAKGFTDVYNALGVQQWTAAGVALVDTADHPPACDTHGCAPPPVTRVPTFVVDPTFPKPIGGSPLELADISGLHIDTAADDAVWLIQRHRSGTNARGLPPVLKLSAEGDLLAGWGGPTPAHDWPENEHGMYRDHTGAVWVCGGLPSEHLLAAAAGRRFPPPEQVHDRFVLKLDPATNGSLLLQVGSPYAAGPAGSLDTANFNRPSEAVVDAAADEVFVADGYGNQRVIVLDATTCAASHALDAPHALEPASPGPADQPAVPLRSLRCLDCCSSSTH